jgi:DNA-binding transcriptional MocR family regulator
VDIDHVLDGGPTTPFGNAISNASFSKLLAPGLRTGWAEATPTFIRGLSQCGSSVSGGAPSHFVASIIAQTLSTGTLQNHIEKVLMPSYKRRYQIVLCALERYLLPLGVVLEGNLEASVRGGYFVYILLPARILAKQFALRAWQEEAVLVADGDMFEISGDEDAVPARHGVRICFAWEEEHFLVEGLRRLGKVLAGMLESKCVNGRGANSGIFIGS